MDERNPKNYLKERLERLGLAGLEVYEHEPHNGGWRSTVAVTLPDGRAFVGQGVAHTNTDADKAAAAALLGRWDQTGPDSAPTEDATRNLAQRGDVLVKLAAYLAFDGDPDRASRWLQRHESDAHLSATFARLKADGAFPGVGDGLGEKARATLVEAEIWSRFAHRVLAPGAEAALAEIKALVEGGE